MQLHSARAVQLGFAYTRPQGLVLTLWRQPRDVAAGSYGGRGRGRGLPQRGAGRPPQGPSLLSIHEVLRRVQDIWRGKQPTVKPSHDGDGLAYRPDKGGTIGTTVPLLANHFKVNDLPKALTLQMYDVVITRVRQTSGKGEDVSLRVPNGAPNMPPATLCRTVLHKLSQTEGWPTKRWAYDGQKLLWTVGQYLPDQETSWEVSLQNRQPPQKATGPGEEDSATVESVFQVTITPVQDTPVIDLGQKWSDYRKAQRALSAGTGSVGSVQVPGRSGLQALDVALRHGFAATSGPDLRVKGQGVYFSEDRQQLGFNLEAWRGFAASLSVEQEGLSVVVDPAVTTVGSKKPLLEWLQAQGNVRSLTPTTCLEKDTLQRLNRELQEKPVKVEVTHRGPGGPSFTVKGLTLTSVRDSMFETKDRGKISVEQYFKEQYNMALKYPFLPCAVVGNSKKPVWLPVEVCDVLPSSNVVLTGDQTSQVLRMAALRPEERVRATLEVVKSQLKKSSTAETFGVKIDRPQMMKLKGRVLPSPTLEVSKGQHVDAGDRGSWSLGRAQFHQPAKLTSCAVVSLADPRRLSASDVTTFMQGLLGTLRDKGLTVPSTPPPLVAHSRGADLRDTLTEAVSRAQQAYGSKPQLVVVITSAEGSDYRDIKRVCDCELGVQSQVVLAKNVTKAAPATLANISLKVNMKLGGDLSPLSIRLPDWAPALKQQTGVTSVMFLGADITHPETGRARAPPSTNATDPSEAAEQQEAPAAGDAVDSWEQIPSVAAVVGSTNPQGGRYAARVTAQASLLEIIISMEQSVRELLLLWQQNNGGSLPEALFVYRDGLSDGQFKTALKQELAAIRKACKSLQVQGQPYNPKVVYVTVQKRHQTRLYPDGEMASDTTVGGRSGNVRPGVVVDTSICQPTAFDFFLNSHAGIQGTNRPAHYYVLHDDLGVTSDVIQLLSNWLCYTFCRCTRSVSYASPAYYADLAATRGRLWLYQDTQTASGGGGKQKSLWKLSSPDPTLLDTMYFV